MGIKRFEDILAWKKAKVLTILVYQTFRESKDFGFKDQIQRASVSIMNNIAEGFERQTSREFIQSLFIAKGSCGELRSMLYLSKEVTAIDHKELDYMLNLAKEISRMLSGLIKTLR